MFGSSKLVRAVSAIRRRFSGRDDTEAEQAFVRLTIGILLFLLFSQISLHHESYENWDVNFLWVMLVFIAASIVIITHIAAYPRISPIRRLVAASLDSLTITCFFFNSAESAIPLYFLYLWIIFGYGFRFGRRYMFFALALSLIGFGAVLLVVPYWSKNLYLGIGLWAGMLLLSVYVSTLVGRLTAALEHAEAANLAKRRFISSVSHELRTPLNALIGMADLLRSTKLSNEQEDMVRSMDNASHMMLTLIEDVLDFSKIEAGKLVIENTEFDLHQLINSTVDIFKYQASKRGLSLLTYIDPRVPYALHGGPHHLRQVLVNLLSNSIKFTKEGRVVLRINCLVDTAQVVQLRFEVEDTGIGIAAEAQAKVFDSFTQADGSTSRRYGGTGLGTTISKQLVEQMGGKLGLRSELGVGSTFWFELELQKQIIATDQQACSGLRILLIGFNQVQAPYITEMLKGWSVSYQPVDDIGSALAHLKDRAHSGNQYQLALLSQALVNTARLSGQPTEIFLQQTINDLHRAANAKLSIVFLCGADGLGGQSDQQIAEKVGLSAAIDFPIDKRLLFNALHAAKAEGSTPQEEVPPAEYHQDKKPQHAQYSILVAEDNATNSKVIQKILERAGHQCTLVENGEEALDQLGHQDFDIVVFDMNMPVMNGLEATKAYRFMRPADMRAPVIMFSANVTTEAKEECLNAGVDEFLPKPIQVASFLETLDRLVEKFGTNRRTHLPYQKSSGVPILAQPPGETVLNYATLAELERIGQNWTFVDDLLSGFIEDNRRLVDQLEEALRSSQFEEFKEILHAIKGSAVSIGALSMRTACQRFEKMAHSELKRDTEEIINFVKSTFDRLCQAVDHYRKQRDQVASHNH